MLRILSELAPDAEVASLDWDERLRDQLDIDSMDFLNFLITVHEKLGGTYRSGITGNSERSTIASRTSRPGCRDNSLTAVQAGRMAYRSLE